MSNITVYVKARPGAAGIFVERRCRCGMCFDTVGRTVSVTEDQLALLKADPMLVVADAPASDSDAEVVEVVETATVAASGDDAPKAEASAKADKNAAKAAKKAG